LNDFRDLIADRDAEALRETFDQAVDARILWLEQRKEGYPDAALDKPELPTLGGFLGSFLGLGRLRRSDDEEA
jgi:hypothetical protein